MEHGNQLKSMLMFMWVHMKVIRKVVMDDMYGPMDAFTKEISLKMLSKLFSILDMEREDSSIPTVDRSEVFGRRDLYWRL
jgi:hypothetical protein